MVFLVSSDDSDVDEITNHDDDDDDDLNADRSVE